MKNTRIIQISILTLTLCMSYVLDLNANERFKALDDTTEIKIAPIKTIYGYSLMESFLDDFEFNENTLHSEKKHFKATPQLMKPNTKQKDAPAIDLNKFHEEDFFNHIEDSVQYHLVKHQLNRPVYRDYFRIPLKLAN